MVATSKIILPYEPGYVGNKEADKQRQQTKEQLRKREREFAERQQPPLIVPERLKVFLPVRTGAILDEAEIAKLGNDV